MCQCPISELWLGELLRLYILPIYIRMWNWWCNISKQVHDNGRFTFSGVFHVCALPFNDSFVSHNLIMNMKANHLRCKLYTICKHIYSTSCHLFINTCSNGMYSYVVCRTGNTGTGYLTTHEILYSLQYKTIVDITSKLSRSVLTCAFGMTTFVIN